MPLNDRPVILPGRLLEWSNLKLQRDSNADCFRAVSGPFEWEVDASMDIDDDQYEARVSYKGVKIAIGRGKTRFAALSDALTNLSALEAQSATEVVKRREATRANKNRTVRYT